MLQGLRLPSIFEVGSTVRVISDSESSSSIFGSDDGPWPEPYESPRSNDNEEEEKHIERVKSALKHEGDVQWKMYNNISDESMQP